jgi:hypothetical protein
MIGNPEMVFEMIEENHSRYVKAQGCNINQYRKPNQFAESVSTGGVKAGFFSSWRIKPKL